MKNLHQWLACLFLSAAAVSTQLQAATTDATEEELIAVTDEAQEPQIEAEALAVLKAMSDVLAATQNFDYEVETAFDVVQRSGTKVEFGATRQVHIARPDRMRMEVKHRQGTESLVLFDSENLWVYVPEQNVFAKTEQQGELLQAIQYTEDELDIEAPLQSLAAENFYETVMRSEVTRALLLDESVIAGVACDHLLLSNDYTDFQLWISKAEQPTLQRVVITYREARGEPQFQAQFRQWDLSPKRQKNQFRFEPPKGANQVRFYVPAPPTDIDQEDK